MSLGKSFFHDGKRVCIEISGSSHLERLLTPLEKDYSYYKNKDRKTLIT